MKKTCFKATGLYTIGNIFNKAISLLLLPIFTRLLSAESYGIVSTYNSWMSLATIIIGLQLYLTLRSAYLDYGDRLYSYIASIDSLICCFFLVFSTIIIIICVLFFKSIPLIVIIFCLVHSFMQSIINVELQRQMMALEYVKRTLLLATPNLVAAILGIIIIVLWPSTDYMGRICSWVIVYIIVGSIFLISHLRKGKTYFDKYNWKYGLSYSIPLIFHGLAGEALNSFDKTMITSLRSASETGIYSVSYTIGMAVKIITSSVESVWVPWFTQQMMEGNKKKINQIASVYLEFISIICAGAMLCLPEVLKIFSERSYWEGVYAIPPIVLASFVVFLYSLSVDIEYFFKATKIMAINTAIAAISNICLNFIFIPLFGAIAAAYTTVASYTISFLIHYITARKLDNALFPFHIYIIPIITVLAGTMLAYIFMEIWIIRWAVAFVSVGVVAIVAFRKYGLINLIKQKIKD